MLSRGLADSGRRRGVVRDSLVTGGQGWGNLFKITSDGSYAVVHAFSSVDPAGYNPAFSLLQTADGNIYGSTFFGGGWNDGTVFRAAADGTVTVVHSFNGFYEGLSATALIQGTDGNFYGTLFDGSAAALRPMVRSSS